MKLTAKECLNMIMILIVNHFAPKTPVGLLDEAPGRSCVIIQDRSNNDFYLLELRKIESNKIVAQITPENIINHGGYNAN